HLGLHVGEVVPIERAMERAPVQDRDSASLDRAHLFGVVGEQPHAIHFQVPQHLERGIVTPLVRAEAERAVRVDRVEAAFLEGVGAELVPESDAPTFLSEVEEHPTALLHEIPEAAAELLAAVALQAAE